MHAMFKNVVPMLLDLWTQAGKWEKFGAEHKDYHLPAPLWAEIGLACAASGDTIPATFGYRVLDLKEHHG
jgi:hypothetical protein